jgi:hypothetical protein
MVTVPPVAGMYTVYCIDPATAPVVDEFFAAVVIDTAVKLSLVVGVPTKLNAALELIPPVNNRFE